MKNTLIENLNYNPLSDAIGMEEFQITEDFESVFSSLVGVYSRLASKEKFRRDRSPDQEKISAYIKRSKELYMLKSSIRSKPLLALKDAIIEYRPELKEMEGIEKELSNA